MRSERDELSELCGVSHGVVVDLLAVRADEAVCERQSRELELLRELSHRHHQGCRAAIPVRYSPHLLLGMIEADGLVQ